MATEPLVADLLQEADHLEASGRPLDAVAVLTDANRIEPDIEIERRLLELRASAFASVDRTHGVEQWPPTVEDPFPDVVGVPPEVHRRDLTPAIIAGAIGHHGSLIVRELVSPDDIAQLQDAIRRAFEAREAYAAGRADESTAGWYTPFEAGRHHEAFGSKRFVRIIDSPRTLYRMLQIYEDSGLLDIIEAHLGERPALSAHKCALRRMTPEPGEFSSDYHQDGSFLGDHIRTVNVWLPLMECGGDARRAGIDVVPRRIDSILETGVDGATFEWTISESVVARAAEGTAVVRPEFGVGDALLFDEVMVHRTGLSEGMDQERMAIEAWFFAPSEYPADHVPLMV